MSFTSLRYVVAPVVALLLVIVAARAEESQSGEAPPFSGTSKTTPTLRRDILGTLLPLFHVHEHCESVDSIDATFIGLDKDDFGRVTGMREQWRAIGCGRSALYDVRLVRTKNDQTDFVVKPASPAP